MQMSVARAETWVTMSAAVTFGSVSVGKLTKGEIPSGRQVASTCLAFAALGAMSIAAPDVAGGLAIAVGGTAFVTYGLPVILSFFPADAKASK